MAVKHDPKFEYPHFAFGWSYRKNQVSTETSREGSIGTDSFLNQIIIRTPNIRTNMGQRAGIHTR